MALGRMSGRWGVSLRWVTLLRRRMAVRARVVASSRGRWASRGRSIVGIAHVAIVGSGERLSLGLLGVVGGGFLGLSLLPPDEGDDGNDEQDNEDHGDGNARGGALGQLFARFADLLGRAGLRLAFVRGAGDAADELVHYFDRSHCCDVEEGDLHLAVDEDLGEFKSRCLIMLICLVCVRRNCKVGNVLFVEGISETEGLQHSSQPWVR